MRMIKGIVLVVAGLFIMVTLISLLIPNKILITRATPVHADSVKIFNEISDLRNWQHWHPVFKNDSGAMTYSSVTDQVNSSVEWMSSGKKNRLVITEKKYPIVKIALQRQGENEISNMLSVSPVQEQGNMQVQWASLTKLKWYPWEKFGGIFIEKMTGPGYETALQSLKEYLESHQ